MRSQYRLAFANPPREFPSLVNSNISKPDDVFSCVSTVILCHDDHPDHYNSIPYADSNQYRDSSPLNFQLAYSRFSTTSHKQACILHFRPYTIFINQHCRIVVNKRVYPLQDVQYSICFVARIIQNGFEYSFIIQYYTNILLRQHLSMLTFISSIVFDSLAYRGTVNYV